MEIINNELSFEILKALSHFVERQQLVVQVMQELDIDLKDTGRWGTVIWSNQGRQTPHYPVNVSASSFSKELREAIDRACSRKPVTQDGQWGDSGEWTYFLHGKGCTLHNSLTGEEIDWDCPNPRRFDRYFFLQHLRWRLETEKDNFPQIRKKAASSPDGLEFIIEVFEQMVNAGLINRDYTLPTGLSSNS